VAVNKFEEDILRTVRKAVSIYGDHIDDKLARLSNRLIELHRTNKVKVNHSVMEIVMGAYLINHGYEVYVEEEVGDLLTADVVAYRNGKKMIIEIETGFVSPENALDPQSYLMARMISKVARYGKHADIFSFATPLHNILQISSFYLKPLRHRRRKETILLKNLCDRYYPNAMITLEDIEKSQINSIYLLDIDTLEVKKLTPRKYVNSIISKLIPKQIDIKKYIEWSQLSEQVKA